ncbi:bromodomain-containing protein 4-like [Belonocnema kinseyi]|uniref:bromodomain-containing protein 4-like n=1 Tax=Belonocnema kinseyi TaxID=2817044 RepID=UPI00143D3EF2|nr:bromodomain-containing protein 4-like [Belonocnema kinseyi]
MKKSEHHLLHGCAILVLEELQHLRRARCYSARPAFFLSRTKAHLITSSSYGFIEIISRIGEAMQLLLLTLLFLGLTLTQSTPVAKKVEKRTAIESTKTEILPKFLNAKDDTEKFKPKTLKFEESKIEKFIDDKKDEKVKEGQDLKNDDKLRPEDDSETLEVDREKKSCKTVKTPAPPPTKICLEIASSPGEVEICQDDPPPPPPVEERISFEPQPVFEIPQQVICEQPQIMCVPAPPPPQPSTICYEAAPPPPPQPSTICFETAPPPPPQPSTICFESSPQQIMHQQPSVVSVLPQMLQPQIIQPQMVRPQMIQPQMVQPQIIQPQMVQPQIIQIQPEYTQPQTIQFQPSKHNFQPTKLHHQFQKKQYQGHRHGNANLVQPSAPIMQYPAQSQLTSCTCQVTEGNSFSSAPGSSGTFGINPTGPTAPGATVAISDGGVSQHSGARLHAPLMNQGMTIKQPTMQQQPIMMQSQPRMVQQQQPLTVQSQPIMLQSQPRMVQSQPMTVQSQPMMVQSQPRMVQSQPMMMQQQPMISTRVSALGQGVDVSLGSMSGQMRHTRDESGSPPHDLETEKNSHNQSSEKEEQSTQISLSKSSSSPPTLRINTSPHQSSQNRFSQSNLMSDNNNMNQENLESLRSIDIQGPGMQSFSFGRSRQKLNDDALSNNERFENINGM